MKYEEQLSRAVCHQERLKPGCSNMSGIMRKPVFGVSKQVLHKPGFTARGLQFQISKVEGFYNLCSKNKGADQLGGYRAIDLRLCFHICKKSSGFLMSLLM